MSAAVSRPQQLSLALTSLPPPPVPPPSLVRFVVLSMLLHLWVVLLFGDTIATADRQTGVLWGQINISLKRLPLLTPDRETSASETGAPPSLKRQRVTPATAASPQEANLARSADGTPGPSTPASLPPSPPAAAESAAAPAQAAVIAIPPPLVPIRLPQVESTPTPAPESQPLLTVPRIEAFLPPVLESFSVQAAPATPPPTLEKFNPPAAPQMLPALQVPAIARELLAPIEQTRAVPNLPPALEALAAPQLQREVARPVELAPFANSLPAAPSTLPAIAAPTLQKEVLAPAELPQFIPALPSELPALSSPSAERAATETPALSTFAPLETPAASSLQPLAAPRIERDIAPMLAPAATERTAAPVAESTSPERASMPAQSAPARDASPAVAPLGPERELLPSPALPAGRRPEGRPQSVDDLFGPERRDPARATTPASRIDVDAARQRAREIASEGAGRRAILPFPMPPKPAYKSKEELAFDKALQEPDCKTAYADLGLLAIAPLLWSSIAPERKCKW